MIEIKIPGCAEFSFHHLVLDVNGTIAKDGQLLPGVYERLDELRREIEVHLATADTHGTLEILQDALRVKAYCIPHQSH